MRLAAVVTLVDALNFLASRAVSVAVAAQVAYADVVLVTKAELAGDPRPTPRSRPRAQLAPRALVRRGTTDEHAAWLEQVLADPSLERRRDPAGHRATSTTSTVGMPTGMLMESTACGSTCHAPVDLEELEDQLAELPANYVRIKGIVEHTRGVARHPSRGASCFVRAAACRLRAIGAPGGPRKRAVRLRAARLSRRGSGIQVAIYFVSPVMTRALLASAVLAMWAGCGQGKIDVKPGATADYNHKALLAAVDKFVAAGRTPDAYGELAQTVSTLRPGMDRAVAKEAELKMVVLALGPLKALDGKPIRQQIDALALTVWPALLAPPIEADKLLVVRDPKAPQLVPKPGENADQYLERLCGGPLAGDCKHVVPEWQGSFVEALALRRGTERVRNAVTECQA